jgi:hypothetical protein
MAPAWVSFPRPLILLILGIDLLVTTIFNADVNEQAGAYATGVLALIMSASVAVALAQSVVLVTHQQKLEALVARVQLYLPL